MEPIQYVPFTFAVEQAAEQAYVLVRSADSGAVQLAEMQKAAQGGWQVTLKLRPGTYRHRFYLELDGVNVVLPGWAATPCMDRDGFDGVIELVRPNAGPTLHTGALTLEEQSYVTQS